MFLILLYLMCCSQDLLDDVFQGILTSPEMCLEHGAFREMTDENFSKNICVIINVTWTSLIRLYTGFTVHLLLLRNLCSERRLRSAHSHGGPKGGSCDVTSVTQWGVPETKCTRRYGATCANF